MNAERLHVIALALRDDLQRTKLVKGLQNLANALQNQVGQPQNVEFQKQVSQHQSALYRDLSEAPSNEFSPAWKLLIQELGVADLLGENIKVRLEEIFQRNQITPSVAQEEVLTLHKQVEELSRALGKVIEGFGHFGIGAERLEAGQFELGVLVPRASVDNRLDNFGQELSELDQIFGTFAELATGSRPGFEIRSISASDLTVFLDVMPKVAACTALAVERIVALYKKLLEIRKLRKELQDQGLSAKELAGVQDHANNHMDKGIDKLVKELIKRFWKKEDVSRRNELSNDLRISLKKIANRVDKGYNIEIRVEPTPEEEEGGTGKEKPSRERREHIELVQSASKTLQFIKWQGEPILSLPESKKTKRKKKNSGAAKT